MTAIPIADRAVISVSGTDAEDFLQGIVTTDLAQMPAGEIHPGALLTPQGKILFAFLVSRSGDGFRLDTDAEQATAFLKRLTMYRLRAAVALDLVSPAAVSVHLDNAGDGLRDMRFAKAGIDVWRRYDAGAAHDDTGPYEALRINAGIAEAGKDYALQDVFPHDVLMDRDGGLSFRKGCYVGQEVVSRMQHRGTARRRVVHVVADGPLPETGAPITVNGRALGTLGSRAGANGLAIVRIDKAGEAMAQGASIVAGETPVRLSLPAWSGLEFPTASSEETA